MKPVNVTFSPNFYEHKLGVRYTRSDWEDPIRRTEMDREIRRMLYDRFGHVGIGEKDPAPNPNIEAYGHRFMPALLGCEIRYHSDQAPAAVPIDDAWNKLENFSIESFETSDVMCKQACDAEILRKKYGHCSGMINTGSALNVAVIVFGEEFLVACASEPELATHVLTDINRLILKLYEKVTHRYQPDIYPLPQIDIAYGNCPAIMLSPAMYRRVVLPADLWMRRHAPNFHLHHCGVFDGYIDLYQELKPTTLDISGGSNYALIRKAFPKTPFSLIINAPDVELAKPAQIDELVGRMAHESGPDEWLSYIWVSELGSDADDEVVCALATAHERI